MTLDDIRVAVRRRAGVTSTDPMAADADLTELVNEALHAISTETTWPWLETTRSFNTVAADGDYVPGTRWVVTRSLKIDTYQPLIASSRSELDQLYPTAATTGLPTYYAVTADALILRPIPDAVYSVTETFFQYEPTLSSSSESPLMPVWAHGSIVEWAASLLLSRLGEDDRALVAQTRATDWLRRMHDNARRTTAPMRVRVRPGSPV